MTSVTVPEILNIPEKLIPILTETNKYRYFLIEGGRGGGKSQAVGRFILYLAEKLKLRIVCGRETQNSITESVYSLLTDLIQQYNLYFDVQASKIIHRDTGTTINFRGFREQGRFNIQGMEAISVVWIDEAQAITKQTLDVLIPTIRKEKAKVFFTMNRHIEKDPVFEAFRHREDCLHIHLNYVDNPFCTQALIREAEECKKISEDDYNHIWLGQPLTRTEDALFGYQELKDTQINKHTLHPGYGIKLAGFDVARFGGDKCAAVTIQQMGALHWEQIFADEWDHKDLNYTTGRILMTATEQDVLKSKVDEDGIGAGPLDTLNKGRGLENFEGFKNTPISYKNDRYYANQRTLNAYKLKNMVTKGWIAINNEKLVEQLCTLRFTFDHLQRRILIPKDVMKTKFKTPSPDLADALIMAVSLIGNVKAKQEEQYRSMPTHYTEENLFNLAGLR